MSSEQPHSRWQIVVYQSPNLPAAIEVQEKIKLIIANEPLKFVVDHGQDLPLRAADYGDPSGLDNTLFGNRKAAHALIHADLIPPECSGQDVNVVLVDAGLNKSTLPATARWGGGWQPLTGNTVWPPFPEPGETTGVPSLHAAMILNNILAVAPQATIFDVPLIIPPKIEDVPGFLSIAWATFNQILTDIKDWRQSGFNTGPWIFVNAWAIYDRTTEMPVLGAYTENKGLSNPPDPAMPDAFILKLEELLDENIDFVFCAGNCGEICPDDRCGPNDYGPGRGIWGANAHGKVLTVGAVRSDKLWLGYSSEGPGPTPFLEGKKPDLVVPSQFAGTHGEYPPNLGTSAAAGLAAGVVAAIRTCWDQNTVPPAQLKAAMLATAQPTNGIGWNAQTGYGILDACATIDALPP
jgi:hypothetical protein